MQEEEIGDGVSPLKIVYPMCYGRPPFIGLNEGKLEDKLKPKASAETATVRNCCKKLQIRLAT
ncbi:uncharacterized protein G2W53_039834 [Senna tora]|uniref:Uncharacterized protein n=1 Tax=Senna tora TaxID=362788 RepID=A0A834SR79_9FABA|nr:uncharacterized protein G2W53_039834 [Senna tora]